MVSWGVVGCRSAWDRRGLRGRAVAAALVGLALVAAAPPRPAQAAADEVPAPAIGPAPAEVSPSVAEPRAPEPRQRWLRGVGLASLISGASLFTVTYAVTAVTGVIMHDVGRGRLDEPARAERGLQLVAVGKRLTIPLAGPWLAMPRMRDELGQIGAGFSGVLQAGGLFLAIAGAIQLGTYHAINRGDPGVALGPRLRLGGAPSPGGAGLQLRF